MTGIDSDSCDASVVPNSTSSVAERPEIDKTLQVINLDAENGSFRRAAEQEVPNYLRIPNAKFFEFLSIRPSEWLKRKKFMCAAIRDALQSSGQTSQSGPIGTIIALSYGDITSVKCRGNHD